MKTEISWWASSVLPQNPAQHAADAGISRRLKTKGYSCLQNPAQHAADAGISRPSKQSTSITRSNRTGRLALIALFDKEGRVWNQPYLETCCRSALHRLYLCGQAGRPGMLMDQPCQERLARLGLCELHSDGRFRISADGLKRHESEIAPGPRTIRIAAP